MFSKSCLCVLWGVLWLGGGRRVGWLFWFGFGVFFVGWLAVFVWVWCWFWLCFGGFVVEVFWFFLKNDQVRRKIILMLESQREKAISKIQGRGGVFLCLYLFCLFGKPQFPFLFITAGKDHVDLIWYFSSEVGIM